MDEQISTPVIPGQIDIYEAIEIASTGSDGKPAVDAEQSDHDAAIKQLVRERLRHR